MRTILLATVAGVLLAGNVVAHADWRKTTMTALDHARYDIKQLHIKRPNEPPPTQSGKLEGGIKIEHEPGSAAAVMTDLLSGQVQLYFGRSTRASPIPRSRRGLPTSVATGRVMAMGLTMTLAISART